MKVPHHGWCGGGDTDAIQVGNGGEAERVLKQAASGIRPRWTHAGSVAGPDGCLNHSRAGRPARARANVFAPEYNSAA